MLTTALVAFAATTDFDAARAFYGDVLGLGLVEASPHALVYDAHGTQLRITLVREAVVAPYTVLGWRTDDIAATIAELTGRGVEFARFDGVEQDADGVWTAPSGARIAWFRDPEGHTLSLQES